MMVYAVKDMDDFNNQLTAAGGKLVLVDFHAIWCGPCKMVATHLEEMSETMEDVVFLKMDVYDCEDIVAEYKITVMPTFLFIKSKFNVADLTGAGISETLEKVSVSTTFA